MFPVRFCQVLANGTILPRVPREFRDHSVVTGRRMPREAGQTLRDPHEEAGSLFESLGLTRGEEEVYRALLASPRLSRRDLAARVGVTSGDLANVLRSLEQKGLLSRSPEKRASFIPISPTAAVDSLIRRREREMGEVRQRAQELEEELHLSGQLRYPLELIEIVRGREDIVDRFIELQHNAREEILTFERPPYASFGVNPVELEQLQQGIRYRSVYDREALETADQIEVLRKHVEAGEEVRVAPRPLPMKLALGDGSTALVPLTLSEPGIEACVVIHSSALLEALRELFELTWQRAVPLRWPEPAASGESSQPEDELTEEDERLLVLLATGLKDEGIAKQLGVSSRTFYRRLERLMNLLGADTRFQAGLQAVKRGHL